ncbi:unnamed protein product [Ilex paraguariensis]|uniref:Alcohol dehydrogenase-like C-terminal domain-containing protein n=1 Tax=Ilex paraguariensis TaxID=185542 RepID=A0ABC8SWD2_9AQUA
MKKGTADAVFFSANPEVTNFLALLGALSKAFFHILRCEYVSILTLYSFRKFVTYQKFKIWLCLLALIPFWTEHQYYCKYWQDNHEFEVIHAHLNSFRIYQLETLNTCIFLIPVGVGEIVGSGKTCEICQQDLENYCAQLIFTYNSIYKDGTKTYGGYSDIVVVDQRYVLRFPDNLPSDAGAPLLCAGITLYSPMKYYGMTEPGKHLGVAGLGGLGHVAVKLGKAFGLKVTVISTSHKKESEAINKVGADYFLVSSNPEKMKVSERLA